MQVKSKYKICRRLGPGVYEKCQNPKFAVRQGIRAKSKKTLKRPKPLTGYGLQLIEKQKIRFSYGISEKQLRNYVSHAVSVKGTTASHKLYELLETRLDNTVYRMGLAETRRKARQMVSHGHILLNNIKNNIPSARVKIGDVITIREGSRGSALFQNLDKRLSDYNTPVWLKFDPKAVRGEILSLPEQDQTHFDIGTVLEFYSR